MMGAHSLTGHVSVCQSETPHLTEHVYCEASDSQDDCVSIQAQQSLETAACARKHGDPPDPAMAGDGQHHRRHRLLGG